MQLSIPGFDEPGLVAEAAPPKAPVTVAEVPRAPDAQTRAKQKAEILQALQWAGDEGVTTLRMREICPTSLTQRISDLRKEGHNIVCEARGNSNWYFLK